ncbi:hypothetical protein V6N13_042742 [Hibiscus sabdariffa]|uniref:Uncharacterized protein n=1 Tax=Hibiscus sabdariffa TaxID=183260 RepID=A0ABR2G4G0_9ROSI
MAPDGTFLHSYGTARWRLATCYTLGCVACCQVMLPDGTWPHPYDKARWRPAMCYILPVFVACCRVMLPDGGTNGHPVSVEPPAQAILPPRVNKRHASHSDPTKVKRSQPSSFVSQIPPVPSAGMSSANNSSAETARQSHREK